jgi:hypothetical protein
MCAYVNVSGKHTLRTVNMLLKKKYKKDYFDNPVTADHAEDFTVRYYITYIIYSVICS